MHGTASRLAAAEPRLREPAEDPDYPEVVAIIVAQEVQVDFGLIDGVIEITGTPGEWSVTAVHVPAHPAAIGRFDRTRRWDPADWHALGERRRSPIEFEIWRGLVETVTDDIAARALLSEMGV